MTFRESGDQVGDDVVSPHDRSRFRMMVEVTIGILRSDEGLRLCEGLRLIDAARQSATRMGPDAVAAFDSYIYPQMRRVLLDRFGIEDLPSDSLN
jgi:hypothetical protein